MQLALTPQSVYEYTPLLESETKQLLRRISGRSTDCDFFKVHTSDIFAQHMD
jgi:hypothetical protein